MPGCAGELVGEQDVANLVGCHRLRDWEDAAGGRLDGLECFVAN